MTDKELKNKLAKIGYSTLWLDYGILTIEYLIEQEDVFDNSDDQNTEHYRYSTFRQYLNSKNNLTDKELDNYLRLTFADSDTLMAGSAAVNLFNNIDLTDQQFIKLCNSIGHFGEWTERIVTRHTLLRQLRTNKLTDDLFNECIENGDSIVQGKILDIAETNQLELLAFKGKNKKIRNTALERLKRLKQ
jgi:hypothetical protein